MLVIGYLYQLLLVLISQQKSSNKNLHRSGFRGAELVNNTDFSRWAS
jgi:hypothetical protein